MKMSAVAIYLLAMILTSLFTGLLLLEGYALVSSPRPPPALYHASEDYVTFLASDAHIVIGDSTLVVPFVALSGLVGHKPSFSLNRRRDAERAKERLEIFREAAVNPDTAPILTQIEIRARAFGLNDFDTSMRRICDRLGRQWSRHVCLEPHAALLRALPNHKFEFFDLRHEPQNHNCVEQQDWVALAVLRKHTAILHCETYVLGSTRRKHYKAVIRLADNLGAMWTVLGGGKTGETALKTAQREGEAIRAFTVYGLAPVENFPRLQEAACKLRRPPPGDLRSGPRCVGNNDDVE